MISFRALIMGLASIILSLLVLTQPSEQQYAWRPQGRFGKRGSYVTDGKLGALCPIKDGQTVAGNIW